MLLFLCCCELFWPFWLALDLANNKLKAISGLSGLSELRKLDLGANRIRVMPPEELSGLVQLEELWLGKNKIERIQGLSTLTKLRRLDLQSNRLGNTVNDNNNTTTKIGPTSPEQKQGEDDNDQFAKTSATLEELYLAHNGIEHVGSWLLGNGSNGDDTNSSPTRCFPELIVLDISRNQLTDINILGQGSSNDGDSSSSEILFPVLEELWLAGNRIADWSAVQRLQRLTSLETLYLEYNPIQTSDPLYRKSLAQLLPQLKQIDATLISAVASNALVGPRGLVVPNHPSTTTTPVGSATTPATTGSQTIPTKAATTKPAIIGVESEQDRMRRYQEMAIQRAQQEHYQQQKQMNVDDDSDDSVQDNNGG